MALLQVTASAAEKALELLAKSEVPDGALRIRVIDGGCSGMRYELAFDDAPGTDDAEWEVHDLRVLVDAESAPFLQDVTVDYSDALNDAGFKINNPGASTTCGCGESFAL